MGDENIPKMKMTNVPKIDAELKRTAGPGAPSAERRAKLVAKMAELKAESAALADASVAVESNAPVAAPVAEDQPQSQSQPQPLQSPQPSVSGKTSSITVKNLGTAKQNKNTEIANQISKGNHVYTAKAGRRKHRTRRTKRAKHAKRTRRHRSRRHR
jgi:hypothetical protein